MTTARHALPRWRVSRDVLAYRLEHALIMFVGGLFLASVLAVSVLAHGAA